MQLAQSFLDHATEWGYDPHELMAFYRGLGPHPKKLNQMAKAIETIAERQNPAPEYLGGGWYRLPTGDKVRGLKLFEGSDDPYPLGGDEEE